MSSAFPALDPKTREIMRYAFYGDMPPRGDLEDAQELLALSFGFRLDTKGELIPGPTNEALAQFIANTEPLRHTLLNLQEEIAIALRGIDMSLTNNVVSPSISLKDSKKKITYSTQEIIEHFTKYWIEKEVGKIAVVAFRHHLPRAVAQVEAAGFEVIVPDLSEVGDFDPQSEQAHTRSLGRWALREMPCIIAYDQLGLI